MPASGSGSATGTIGGAVYSDPTAELIRDLTGVNPKMDNLSSAALDQELYKLLPAARTVSRLRVGAAVFDSATLTADAAYALQVAVAFRTGAAYLRGLASLKATGTPAPRLMEEAAALREQADKFDGGDDPATGQAAIYEDLAVGETPSSTTETLRAGTPFLLTGTYDPGSLTWRPSERLGSLDERDDRPAGSRRW